MAAFFTTVPFGLLPNEHVAWIDAGGGQALWDELYAPFGVKPFMAAALTGRDNVQLRTFPSDLISAARATAKEFLADLAGKSASAAKVRDSYQSFGDKVAAWSRISTQGVLQAREG